MIKNVKNYGRKRFSVCDNRYCIISNWFGIIKNVIEYNNPVSSSIYTFINGNIQFCISVGSRSEAINEFKKFYKDNVESILEDLINQK